jgi:hypothetical protein
MATTESEMDLAKEVNPEHLKSYVKKIHLIATPNRENRHTVDGRSPTNHWRIFLELDENTSVSVNMQYTINGPKQGTMILKSEERSCTKQFVKKVTLELGSAQVHVQEIVELIKTKELHNYIFNEDGEGCRYWNLVFLGYMEGKGYIDEGSLGEAREALGYFWYFPAGDDRRAPRPIQAGEFRLMRQ